MRWIDGDMPFSETFGDHFYAREDGRDETAHVFIAQNRLVERWGEADNFTIGELGFGTGLNLFETWRQWIEHRKPGQMLHFVSFEAFPMDGTSIAKAISRWPDLVPLFKRFQDDWTQVGKGEASFDLDVQTRFEIHVGDALGGVSAWSGRADAWYLDGFAPSRNQAMWSQELMKSVFDHTAPGGSFATYTAAGWVRRNLQSAGFDVEKRPGHGFKREMMGGVRPAASEGSQG